VFQIRIHYMRIRIKPFKRMWIRIKMQIRIDIQAKSEQILIQTLLSQICFYTLDYRHRYPFRMNCLSFGFVFWWNLNVLDLDPAPQSNADQMLIRIRKTEKLTLIFEIRPLKTYLNLNKILAHVLITSTAISHYVLTVCLPWGYPQSCSLRAVLAP
jgi:hypothetical protein